MLKTRVIPVMLWKDVGLVKGRCFNHSRRVGSVLPAVKVFNSRDVDELVLVDVTATLNGNSPRLVEIRQFARECNVPLSVGGGIKSEEDIEGVLRAGADKVVLNSACFSHPKLLTRASRNFGAQCVVASIDYRNIDGTAVCFSHAGQIRTNYTLLDWARTVEELGAGEILLTDCTRDGTMTGYDLETIKEVAFSVGVPVIASGGAGTLDHFVEAVKVASADAVAAGSVFHFTEITPREIKEHLARAGIPVRIGV
jgi:cyclase